MHPGSRVLWRCSAPPAIPPREPQFCQKGVLSILSSIGEQKKVGWMGTTVILFLVKKSLEKTKVWDGACREATASSSVAIVREEVFAHFLAVAVQRHSIMRNWLCRLSGRIICDVLLVVKENDKHAFGFALCTFRARLMLSSPNTCLITGKVSVVLFGRFAQNLMHILCRVRHEIASGQIHDSKEKDVRSQHFHPAAWNIVHLLPRYDSTSTIIYRWIEPLQLLYRWQL
jgi:hypothetical protein